MTFTGSNVKVGAVTGDPQRDGDINVSNCYYLKDSTIPVSSTPRGTELAYTEMKTVFSNNNAWISADGESALRCSSNRR